MIKFFRKIRQNLVMQNKTSKYFKYAIGEIILVVIGILIALQINNWNSNRILQANQLQLSKRLLEETKRNIKDFDTQKQTALKSKSSILSVLHLINKNYSKVNKKVLDSLIFNILVTPGFDFNLSVLNEALSTGQVANFDNETLKNILYSFPTKLKDVADREKTILEDSNNNLIPLIYDYTSLRQIDFVFSGFGEKIRKSNLKETDNRVLLKMRRFENVIDNQYYLFSRLTQEYNKMEISFKILEKLLEKEITDYSPE